MTTTTAPTTPKPRRRWLQFSLRTMILIMLLIGCGLGWFAHERKQARDQRKAAMEIKQLGGVAMQCGRYEPQNGWKSRVPSWLKRILGDDVFLTISYVSLRKSKATDKDLVRLRAFPQLKELDLSESHITDAGLVHLDGTPRLQKLTIGRGAITDEGLVHVGRLSSLRELNLACSKVTDAGLVHLTGLTQLEDLDLRYDLITDVGLVHLQGLTQLTGLNLMGTRITDAGLAHVEGISQLQVLHLYQCRQVTDAGLADLKNALPKLKISR